MVLHTESQSPIELMNLQEKEDSVICLLYVLPDENSKLCGKVAVFPIHKIDSLQYTLTSQSINIFVRLEIFATFNFDKVFFF